MVRRYLCNAPVNCTSVYKENPHGKITRMAFAQLKNCVAYKQRKNTLNNVSEVITLLQADGYSQTSAVCCVAEKGGGTTMQDYTRALRLRFKDVSPQTQALEKERNSLRNQLISRLNKQERKLLLRFTNLEDELRERESIESFVSGSVLPTEYSRNCRSCYRTPLKQRMNNRPVRFLREENKHGKTQSQR